MGNHHGCGKINAKGNPMKLRGVRVHNLQGVDVTIPWGKWVAISGVSGSGKSSLAFDTLYAEGQRRYLESLSPQSRQYLEQLPQPEADHIDPLPPAIAVRQNARTFSPRSTVGSVTEISHYLRLLFSKVGRIVCPRCQHHVRKQTPQDVFEAIQKFPEGQKYQIGFPVDVTERFNEKDLLESLNEQGFTRGILIGTTITLTSDSFSECGDPEDFWIVVDRLTAGKISDERVLDSLEQAFVGGSGRCVLLRDDASSDGRSLLVDGRAWRLEQFSDQLQCPTCGREFLDPEPRLFNPNSPSGACSPCAGTGTIAGFSLEQVVPDPALHLEDGAIACFREPPLTSRESEWLGQAQLAGVPLDVPFAELSQKHQTFLIEGKPSQEFVGLKELFRELQESRKPTVQSFLNRWLLDTSCLDCRGYQLREEALAVRMGELHIGELSQRPLRDVQQWLDEVPKNLTDDQEKLVSVVLVEIQSRINSLLQMGLDYLGLNDPIGSLSSGESQRVALARTVGHQLVNSLYIFDEPSTGLHSADCERVTQVLAQLQKAENTIVVVEHEEDFLNRADHLIDLGPGAGCEGGQVVYQGKREGLLNAPESMTGQYLTGAATTKRPFQPGMKEDLSRIRIVGANRFPLKNVTVEFPLNCLCVLTGVSGSGKTVLMERVLYPALQHILGHPIPRNVRESFTEVTGSDAIDEVVLLDSSPLSGSSRSNPVTFLNVFDEIRRIFAETPEAQKQGFQLKEFSFNSPSGGRCPACAGQGTVDVEMQFLPDLQMACPECQGTRYRPEILTARYRGLNIAEVLNLTVAEAFPFFRTSPRIRKRLQLLKDVGLDYLPLGQPTTLLSGGESQRLKLASYLGETTRGQTLFLLDEPTAGLHPADIQTLLNCFDHLLAVGHSVIVAEHNLHLIGQADWVIDLGPGAAKSGGQVVATGPPEKIADQAQSLTGKWLGRRNAPKIRSGKK